MGKQPKFPFDLTGYDCYSVINCPPDQAGLLIREYEGLAAPDGPVRPFPFKLAPVPEAPVWTAVRWPQPGRFFDLMNLTMWLMGYKPGLGGENPIFIALPPAKRANQGPMIARPEYDNPFGDEMLGFWQDWSFDYKLPDQQLRWIGEGTFPQEYFFNGRGYSSTGFRLEWLDRLTDWTEICITMEYPKKTLFALLQ